MRTRLPLPRSDFAVTALEPGRSWAWHGDLLWLTLEFNHHVEPEGIIGTRITLDLDVTGRGALLVRPIGRLLYGRQMQRALDLLAGGGLQRDDQSVAAVQVAVLARWQHTPGPVPSTSRRRQQSPQPLHAMPRAALSVR